MQHRLRRQAALAAAKGAGADSLVVTHLPDVRWLSGFTGSSGAVALGRSGSALFTDGRYTTQARAEAAGLKVVIGKGSPGAQASAWLAERKAKRCGFDALNTTVAGLEAMRKALPSGLRRSFFLATQGLVARLREVKDADEIVKMRRAAALGCRLFEGVLTNLSAGETENEIALVMELEARRAGAEAMSFETIVASGKRSASAAWPGERGEASEARVCDAGFWSGAGRLLLRHDPDGPYGKGHLARVGRVSFGAGSAAGGGGGRAAGRPVRRCG